MKFELPILNILDMQYTTELPSWGTNVNWSFNASNIKCRAEALHAKVYVINNVYRIIAESYSDLIYFLSNTDSFLQTHELNRLQQIENEIYDHEDQIDDLLWEKEEIQKNAKSPFVLLKNHNTQQLHLQI